MWRVVCGVGCRRSRPRTRRVGGSYRQYGVDGEKKKVGPNGPVVVVGWTRECGYGRQDRRSNSL